MISWQTPERFGLPSTGEHASVLYSTMLSRALTTMGKSYIERGGNFKMRAEAWDALSVISIRHIHMHRLNPPVPFLSPWQPSAAGAPPPSPPPPLRRRRQPVAARPSGLDRWRLRLRAPACPAAPRRWPPSCPAAPLPGSDLPGGGPDRWRLRRRARIGRLPARRRHCPVAGPLPVVAPSPGPGKVTPRIPHTSGRNWALFIHSQV